MSIKKNIAKDLKSGSNLDIYATAFTAVVITIINVVGISFATDNISAITLGILALISFSLLGSRHQIEKILKKMLNSKDSIIVEKFETAEKEKNIEECQTLWLCGVSLLGYFQNNMDTYSKKLEKGHTINTLLVKPNSDSLIIASNRDQVANIDYQRNRIQTTLEYLKKLTEDSSEGQTNGSVNIKTVDNPLDFETIICDYGTRKIMYLKHYGFKTPYGDAPLLLIDNNNLKLFKYFEDHFQNLWKYGEEYTIINENQTET